ncbi:F-box protein At4g35930 [Cryptomeria japonica]|uniref:F-box protein At4g35930 n=1 Tax=Cryptomeria japonica TaxID=3369 RepID=UPI0027D9D4F2|nr:F-box protein At4g35930 [Cryptomeria japonica]
MAAPESSYKINNYTKTMCCKGEGHRTLKHRQDLKMKALKKSPLSQGKKQGSRVLRNAGVKMGVKRLVTKGKKRIATVLDSCENSSECWWPSHSERGRMDAGFCVTTPVKNCFPVLVEEENLAMKADMESLPLDILVRIVCNVHHDELEPLFHVSSKFREAVSIARQMHFDYTTPVRVRASRNRANSLIPDEISQNHSSFEGLECLFSSSRRPATPNAPKQVGKFHKSERISSDDMKNIATLLFPPGTPGKNSETRFVNKNGFLRSGAAPNRVLFVEHEICL